MPTKPKTHAQLMRERQPKPKDNRTQTAAQRGYDGRWQKARASFLRRNPLCLYCRRSGRTTSATLVDHNPPHQGDRKRFWDVKTWTPACKGCHDHVTATFDGGGGREVKPREGIYVAPREEEITR